MGAIKVFFTMWMVVAFACVQALAFIFWTLYFDDERALMLAEPRTIIFYSELILTTIAAMFSIILIMLFAVGRYTIYIEKEESKKDAR